MAMTPAKRHAIRAEYERKDQEKKNIRLGLTPQKIKNKKRKWKILKKVLTKLNKNDIIYIEINKKSILSIKYL